MPIPIDDSTIKTIWENNPDSPITSANLSKAIDYVASYSDFDDGYNGHGSLLIRDPLDPFRLILKRGTIISIVNEAQDPPGSGNYVVPINEQYRVFDLGLEDIWLTVEDRDDDLSVPTGQWGENREWFVYICDKDDNSLTKSGPGDYGGGAQILISRSRNFPTGTVPGRPTNSYSIGDTRKIGGFKTNSSGQIITESVWDISGKAQVVKAKEYYVIDENSDDVEDAYGRHLYRKIRLTDLDSSLGSNNIFNSDVTIEGNFHVKPDSVSSDRFVVNVDSNYIATKGTLQFQNLGGTRNLFVLDTSSEVTTIVGNVYLRSDPSSGNYFQTNKTNGNLTITGRLYSAGLTSSSNIIINSSLTVSNGIETSDTITSNVPTDTPIIEWGTAGYIRKITDQGGLMISCDSTMLLHAGDHHLDYEADFNLTNSASFEDLILSADAKVRIVTGYQDGIGTSHEMTIDSTGGVIISGNLKINGSTKASGCFYTGTTAPTSTNRLNYDGYFYATRVYNAVYNDLAEFFLSKDKKEIGKVYSLYSDANLHISKKRADKKIVGVCSDQYAFAMKTEYEDCGGVPIALAGTIPVYVKSIVNEGDELMSAGNGYACKASLLVRLFRRRAILGKAMTKSIDTSEKTILMLVK